MIIKPIRSTNEIKQVADLEAKTWGEKPDDTVPDHVLTAIAREGGVLLGAYQDDLLIGFTLGWLGTKNPEAPDPASTRLKLVSHMTAVLDGNRDQRVGYQLKLAQRKWAIEQGLDLITWTYDPLESRNGYFNIGLLGCACSTYLKDYYGDMSDKLSRGLPSDRFRVDWWISSPKVVDRLKDTVANSEEFGQLVDDGVQLINHCEKNSDGLIKPSSQSIQITAPRILVEIPTNYQMVRKKDQDLALAWRISSRNILRNPLDLVTKWLILSIKDSLIPAVFTIWNKPMKIEKITLYHLDMPLAHPFETSFGLETRRQCILVAASAGGLTGWGECVALDRPSYSSETVGTAWHILEKFLIPEGLKISWRELDEFLEPLAWIRGNPMARAGLQGAAWDLLAHSQKLSLAAKLAQPYPEGPRARVPVGVSIGIQSSIQATLDRVEKFLGEGFTRIKLKIKPGWDLDLLRAVREQFGDIGLMVDANSAYTMADLDILKSMDQFELIMLEQPLEHNDIYQHSQLQEMLKTPICLDESITSPAMAAWSIKIGACQMINIKPGRVGGLWETRLIHDICRVEGMPVWCGGMLETGIGRAANLAAAGLPNFLLPTDNGPTARYWEEDIVEESFTLNREDSTITVPDRPGLGVTPDLERMDRYLLRKEVYPA